MSRKFLRFAIVGSIVAAFLLPGVGAEAKGVVDLRHVSFANRTIPGSTCESRHPITLHNGHGRGGHHLVIDIDDHPVFGDITHDGHGEAFVEAMCSTGGGTAASQVKDNLVVFSGSGGHVHVLGDINARHVWTGVHTAILGQPTIAHERARVTEYLYAPSDADCCAGQRAHAAWVYRHGALRAQYSRLQTTPSLVTPTRVGRARLGMTVAQLRHAYPGLRGQKDGGGCRSYTNGGSATSRFYALITKQSHGRVMGIAAPTQAVTDRGIGTYSSLANLRHAYRGHKISVFRGQGGRQVIVREPHSYIGMSVVQQDDLTYLDYLRIGTKSYASAFEMCLGGDATAATAETTLSHGDWVHHIVRLRTVSGKPYPYRRQWREIHAFARVMQQVDYSAMARMCPAVSRSKIRTVFSHRRRAIIRRVLTHSPRYEVTNGAYWVLRSDYQHAVSFTYANGNACARLAPLP